MICDLPNKFALVFAFNIPIYFLANLRRTPEAFFIFTLFSFSCLQTGSMLFRLMGALGSTMTGSMAPGTVISSSLILYTGFVLPVDYMHPWLRWFAYINPVAYGFESLMINEVNSFSPSPSYIPYRIFHHISCFRAPRADTSSSFLVVIGLVALSFRKVQTIRKFLPWREGVPQLAERLDHRLLVEMHISQCPLDITQVICGGRLLLQYFMPLLN